MMPKKTIFITGSTDGIGLAAAKLLYAHGHDVLLHGRNQAKLDYATEELRKSTTSESGTATAYLADFSKLSVIDKLASDVSRNHDTIDALINNAGVFRIQHPLSPDGLDLRFQVNTIAPFLLTQKLMPLLGEKSRVINLSSAAQSSVNLATLDGQGQLSDMDAYAQSKLALTMWTLQLAAEHKDRPPILIAVNPGSMLGTKMVKEGFGVAGGDIGIGADILFRAAISDEFAQASGLYFDNDSRRFTEPHPDALKPENRKRLIDQIVRTISRVLSQS